MGHIGVDFSFFTFLHSKVKVFSPVILSNVFFNEINMAPLNRPAPVEVTYRNMRFLITHNPTNATLNKFIEVSVF